MNFVDASDNVRHCCARFSFVSFLVCDGDIGVISGATIHRTPPILVTPSHRGGLDGDPGAALRRTPPESAAAALLASSRGVAPSAVSPALSVCAAGSDGAVSGAGPRVVELLPLTSPSRYRLPELAL